MDSIIRRFASIAIVCIACLSLSGCLISGLSAITAGGITTATATVTLQPASCGFNADVQQTDCEVDITVTLPGGGVDVLVLHHRQGLCRSASDLRPADRAGSRWHVQLRRVDRRRPAGRNAGHAAAGHGRP